MKQLFVGRFSPDLEDTFLRELAQRRDALSPVWILAPTGPLQRRLRRRIAEQGGAAGLRFFGFESLTEEIVEIRLARLGRQRLPEGGDLLLLEEIFRQEPLGYFEPSRNEPRFAAALLATLRDLKDAGITPEELVVGAGLRPARTMAGRVGDPPLPIRQSDKLASIAHFYAAYEKKLAAKKLWDRSDLLQQAILELKENPAALPDDFNFKIYGVYDFTGLQRELLRAICQRVEQVTVFFPPEEEFSKPALQFFRSVCSQTHNVTVGAAYAPPLQDRKTPEITRISAAGEAEEVRELIREILQLEKDGIPLQEIGVVARATTNYDSLLRERFAQAQIPLAAAKAVSLSQSLLGRALFLALSYDLQNGSRRELFSWLALPVFDIAKIAGFSDPPLAEWDALFRKSKIVNWEKGWEKELSSLVLSPVEQEEAKRAARTIRRVLEILSSFPKSGTFSEMTAALRQCIEQLFLASEEREQVLEEIQNLSALECLREKVEKRELLEILSQRLEAAGPAEKIAGVFWGDALAARGLSFRALFILGLAEKQFPRLPRTDPILLDNERALLSQRLAEKYLQGKSRAREEEPFLFHLLCQGAREKLFLLRSRLDPVGGKSIVPSSFLRDFPVPEQTAPLKFWSAKSRGLASSTLEFDLRLLDSFGDGKDAAAAYLESVYPKTLSAGFALEKERWSFGHLSPYDGAIGKMAQNLPGLSFQGPIAPTRLENLARCPFQFFLQSGLGLSEWEEPEEEEEMDPLDRGSMLHAILSDFFSALPKGKKLEDFPLEELDASLQSAFDKHWQRAEQVGIPGAWADRQALKEELRQDLLYYLKEEIESGGVVPAELEWKIPQGIIFSTGKTSFALSGRVDRIDRIGDRALVIDFKSGRRPNGVESLLGGTRIQVSLYAHAVAQVFGLEEVSGEYHYLKDQKKATPASLGQSPEVQQITNALLGLAEKGLFPQIPETCGYCSFRNTCATEQTPVFERKKSDPRLTEFLAARFPEKPKKEKKAKRQ